MKLIIKSDTSQRIYGIVVTLIADFLLIFFGILENTLIVSGIIALIISLVVTVIYIVEENEELIIDGELLCYKSIRKKYYNINDVKGLHIVKAQIAIGKTLSGWDLKNKYVIIYLKDRDFEWHSYQGSVDFLKWHRKHILFTTEYDERAIEIFKEKGIPVTSQNQ